MTSLYLHPKRKKRMKHPEQIVQIGMMSHLLPRQELEDCRNYLVFAVPNGGLRSDVEAGIMKAMGTMAGVSDIILLLPGGKCAFVEIKLRSMVLSKRGPTKGTLVEKCTAQEPPQSRFERRAVYLGFPYRLIKALNESDGLEQMFTIMREFGWHG